MHRNILHRGGKDARSHARPISFWAVIGVGHLTNFAVPSFVVHTVRAASSTDHPDRDNPYSDAQALRSLRCRVAGRPSQKTKSVCMYIPTRYKIPRDSRLRRVNRGATTQRGWEGDSAKALSTWLSAAPPPNGTTVHNREAPLPREFQASLLKHPQRPIKLPNKFSRTAKDNRRF